MRIRTNFTDTERAGTRKPKLPAGEWPATIADAYSAASKRERDAAADEGRAIVHNMLVVKFNVEGPDSTVERPSWFMFDQLDKMARLVDAVRQPGDGDEIDSDDLAARPCRVVIKLEPSRNGDGRLWPEITGVLPPATGSRPTAVEAEVEPINDDDLPF